MNLYFMPIQTLILIYGISSINIYAIQKKASSVPKEWIEVKPLGNTICARGEEFSFFYQKGTQNKWVVDFIGGGACWNTRTCGKEHPTFVDSVDYIRKRAEQKLGGIYDRSNPNNPVKDWNHLIIPYCTGDIHWGAHDTTYKDQKDQEFTIHHQGATNVKSALNWLAEQQSQPEKIFSTGCSAGSYGSIYWTPALSELFSHSKIYQMGDSGVGIITDSFLKNSFTRWQTQKNAPFWVPGLDPAIDSWEQITLPQIYKAIGNYYPNIKFSQFSTAKDEVQMFFYEIMGGDPLLWPQKLKHIFYELDDKMNNFHYYRKKGKKHCILPYDHFYQKNTQNYAYSDWLNDFLNDQPIQNIDCPDCS